MTWRVNLSWAPSCASWNRQLLRPMVSLPTFLSLWQCGARGLMPLLFIFVWLYGNIYILLISRILMMSVIGDYLLLLQACKCLGYWLFVHNIFWSIVSAQWYYSAMLLIWRFPWSVINKICDWPMTPSHQGRSWTFWLVALVNIVHLKRIPLSLLDVGVDDCSFQIEKKVSMIFMQHFMWLLACRLAFS